MNERIKQLAERVLPEAIGDELSDLTDDAFDILKGSVAKYISKPCANHLHHERQLEKLQRKKGRVFARRARLAHHRLWRRYWESRCEALNLCGDQFDEGC